jgi:hypothetical protein
MITLLKKILENPQNTLDGRIITLIMQQQNTILYVSVTFKQDKKLNITIFYQCALEDCMTETVA